MPIELLLALIIVPIILIIIVMVIFIKKTKKPTINIDWLLTILGKNNITEVTKTNNRIAITFTNLKVVDLESLKTQTKGVFVKGNKIVVTFLNNQDEIYESLKKTI